MGERKRATDAAVKGRRHRGVFWVGIVMVLGGLGLLGYVGWQMYGTNVISQQRHEQLTEELRAQWADQAEDGQGRGAAPARVPSGQASALIRIPKFGDDYVVPVLEGVSDEVLASGYGHFEETAGPGQRGNYALAAHRVTHGEPLKDMPTLRPGDEVIVETREATYTYVLDTDPNELIVTFEDYWVVGELPTNPEPGGVQPVQQPGQRLITLTTCSELFHTDNRMIAFGHLVDREPRSAETSG